MTLPQPPGQSPDRPPDRSAATADAASLRLFRLGRSFVLSALLRIPLYAVLGGTILGAAAYAFTRSMTGQGGWSAAGGWTLLTFYTLAGLLGGAIAGARAAAARTFAQFDGGIRNWLEQLPAHQLESSFPQFTPQQLRERYDQIVEAMFGSTLGRFPLPSFLKRMLRSLFRQVVLEDFLEDCERRSVATIGFPEFRTWLLSRGLGLVMAPVYAQFELWGLLLFGTLGLMAGGALVMAWLNA